MNLIFLYVAAMILGAFISSLILYWLSMNDGFDWGMLIGSIWGASAAYMWNKFMVINSLNIDDKEYV